MIVLLRFLSLFIFSLLIFLFPYPAFPQPALNQLKIDSLESLLNKIPSQDTARIPVLKSLSKLYLYQDARKAANYAQEAVNLAEINNLPSHGVFIHASQGAKYRSCGRRFFFCQVLKIAEDLLWANVVDVALAKLGFDVGRHMPADRGVTLAAF